MPRIKKESPILAAPLAEIASTGKRVELAATALLMGIKSADLRTLGAFDDAVKAACESNGWNTRPGKPTKGEDRRAVPHTVRTYVWEIRSAYRAGLEVWKFKTMYELRMSKKAEKDSRVSTNGGDTDVVVELPAEVAQDLEGVRVLAPKQPNGALFHDLISCFIGLPQEQRATFGRQLARLLHRYQAGIVAGAVQHVRGATPARVAAG